MTYKSYKPYIFWALIALMPQWFPALIGGRIPWFMDIVTQFYPMRVHVAHLLWNGELPLWNRTYFAGVPLLANPQWGVLYPGHWPFFLLPCPQIFNLINTAHIASLGVGTFFFLRSILGKKGWAKGPLFAGILIMIAGWTKAHLAFGAYLQVASFFPWMLFASEKFRQQSGDWIHLGGIKWFLSPNCWLVLGGIFAACQILAGAPQLAAYCQGGLILFVTVQFLVEHLFHHRGTETQRTSKTQEVCSSLCLCASVVKRCSSPFKFLAVQGILGILLSAPQWFPTLAFQQECERADKLDLGRVMQGALDLRGLWQAFVGGTGLPEDAETILYPSIPAIVLALLALLLPVWFALKKRPHPNLPTAAIGGSCAGLFAALLLSWNVAAPLFYKILPGYNNFHDPKRILFLAFFFTLILAGIGFQILWDNRTVTTPEDDELLRTRPWYSPDIRVPRARILQTIGLSLAAAVAFLNVFIFNTWRLDIKTEYAGMLNPLEKFIHPGERFFAQDIGIQYSYNYTRPMFAETLLPGLSPLTEIEDIQGYDPLIPKRYAAFMRQVNQGMVTLYPSHFGLVRNPDSPLLSRFGPLKAVGPVDCDWPMLPPTGMKAGEQIILPLQKMWSLPTSQTLTHKMQVYAAGTKAFQLEIISLNNNKPIPKSQFLLTGEEHPSYPELNADIVDEHGIAKPNVQRLIVATPDGYAAGGVADALLITNIGDAPVLLYSVGLPRKHSFKHCAGLFPDVFALPHPDPIETFPTPQPGGQWISNWKYAEKKSNSLRIALPENHIAGWVYIPEPYFSGWSCRVDGQPSQIFPCETMFRAVQVPAGAREIVMTYWPPRLTEGLLLALLGFALSLGLLLPKFRQRFRQD